MVGKLLKKRIHVETNEKGRIIRFGKATINIPYTNVDELVESGYVNSVAAGMALASIFLILGTLTIAEIKPDVFGIEKGYIFLRLPGSFFAFESAALTLLDIDKFKSFIFQRFNTLSYGIITSVISLIAVLLLMAWGRDSGWGDLTSLVLLIVSFLQLSAKKNRQDEDAGENKLTKDMDANTEIYTGFLTYKEIEFTFVFDRKLLRLLPPKDKKQTIERKWKLKEIQKGIYTFADPILLDEEYLVGKCNETGRNIIFLTKHGGALSFVNQTVILPLIAYAICKYDREKFDRITFSCPELNYIYPINQAFSVSINIDEHPYSGTGSLNLNEFEKTTSDKQPFIVDGQNVDASFGISRTISMKIDTPPLELQTGLMFEFEATDDYTFILRLWRVAREFIRFLCYRRNVYITTIKVDAPYSDNKHENFATMFLIDEDGIVESKTLKDGRYIKQEYIAGHEGEILSDIAKDTLYLRHLPESYVDGRHINAARFVMIMSAFEWEFRRAYPDGVVKKEKTIQAENEIEGEIAERVKNTSGKKKEIYKFLKRLIRSSSLQTEIIQVGKDYNDVVGVFGEHLYRLNDQELKYTDMGKRLSDQRNHFAHGDLDQEFIGLSLLDLMYMEYILYAMQLKHYGIEDTSVRKSINDLFHLNYHIE